MSKSPEEATAEPSSCNSSPINVEDDRRHYVASPQEIEFKGEDNNASDNVVDYVKDNTNGNDDEDAGENVEQQLQDQNSHDPSGQQIETKPTDSFREVDDVSIAGEIMNYITCNRINVGELETLEDLWEICDAISAERGGLPDSLLKEAFNIVLDSYYNGAQNNSWQRQQIDKLLRIWKVEMLKIKSTPRSTKFVAAPSSDTLGADKYNIDKESTIENHEETIKQTSTPEETQASEEAIKTARRQKKRKRALAAIMGVGHILSNTRRKMATEDAELEVNEDEYGNFLIGGMPLSFENWGQLNKIKENDIVHIGIQPSSKRLKSNSVSPPPNGVISSQKQQQSELILSMAEKYPTVQEVEMPSNDSQQTTTSHFPSADAGSSISKEVKDSNVVKSPIPPPPKEKDEGELSSSEPSDKPTSSEESSDDESHQKAFVFKKNAALLKKNIENRPSQRPPQQDRRRVKKQDERQQGQQGASSAQNLQQLLQKCFDLRGRIVRKLSIQQKAMFLDLLKQSMAGTLQQGVQNLQQQQAMALLMNTINTSGVAGSSSQS
uniref:Bromo domain-containing protein n=1 Tax=Meloidogyne hapla TaxID=6305 RepID=A0A1I8AYI6_MELHA